VIFSSTAPAAADRNVQTLWIDTTGNANTPKRWTTGTTWVAVTNKVATDAAAAAAAAATAAATADGKAVAAQNTANNASSAVSTLNANLGDVGSAFDPLAAYNSAKV
jgi:hypothetical protein